MFGLTKLWNALRRLAASLEATADTIDELNVGLRSRLMLDTTEGDTLDSLSNRLTVDALSNGQDSNGEAEPAAEEEEEKPKGRSRRGTKAKS